MPHLLRLTAGMMGHYQPPLPQAIPLPPLPPAVPIFELSEVEQRDLVALLTHLHALTTPPPGDKAPEATNPSFASIVSQAKVSQGGSLCILWAQAGQGQQQARHLGACVCGEAPPHNVAQGLQAPSSVSRQSSSSFLRNS